MALEVQRGPQQPQDAGPRWRLPSFLGASPRPDVIHFGSTPSKQPQAVPDAPKETTTHRSENLMQPQSRECRPAVRSPSARAARRPPPTPATSPRRDRTSQFLPIASLLNPNTGLKRRRHDLDVDGPNTATMSSKKRRLRLDLVTSPLSKPYSHPASHIHGRTDVKAIANRSVRLDAALAAQRKLPHLSSASFLRLSFMNRVRERLSSRGPALVRMARLDAATEPIEAAPRASSCQPSPRPEAGSKMQGGFGPPSVGTGRRVIVKRPERLLSARERLCQAPEKALPHPDSRTTAREPTSQTAAGDHGPPSLPEPRSSLPEPRVVGEVHERLPGVDSVTLCSDDDDAFQGIAKRPEGEYCGFGVRFGQTGPHCVGSGDGRADDSQMVGLPWIAR
ncbi:hypothetical protein HIM_03735 [Hirsutella minnesotensis 3608]|uniref:Uncharacterized protein n=1 Tax=Hirsutella minnesotensis 3608 TaxID=1043627 RepID=A0A0F7ZVM2_9HYPO|nr:hypothetical protein HIM_03735 [Hirsutella minnesotensis 3608]